MNEPSAARLTQWQIHRLIGEEGAMKISPASQAMLAQLRRGVGREPGSLPAIWGVTLDGIPDTLTPAQRNRLEWAVHVAMTHFALHQQSHSSQRMHVPTRSLGEAIRDLARASGQEAHESPVYRRFINMASSSQLPAVLTHARGLITQLRGAGIGFNYAQFADDLQNLQSPSRARGVRRRWGRDFHRTVFTDSTTPADSITIPEGELS